MLYDCADVCYPLQCVCREKKVARNSALRQAEAALKKDPRIGNKKIEIVWQKEDKKDRVREVQVDSNVVFIQAKDDLIGHFVGDFANLQI